MAGLIVPVILAGEQGTRLWPASRFKRPKQFLSFQGESSLYQDTLLRVEDSSIYGPPVVVTNSEYWFFAAEQAAEIGVTPGAILLEPVLRNTAAAIAAANAYVHRQFDAETLLHVLPSDHALTVDDAYWSAVEQAAYAARCGYFATFGIAPRFAETGYGYIRAGAEIGEGFRSVERFIEKPDVEAAGRMIDEGGFLWNSGMFMFCTGVFSSECARLAPQMHALTEQAVAEAEIDGECVRLAPVHFARAPNISVDVAIFEKTDKAVVVTAGFGWFDMGNWASVWSAGNKDAEGNFVIGGATLNDASQSLVVSDHAHVVVDGLKDVAVIAHADVVYVSRLSQPHRMNVLIEQLRAQPSTVGLTERHRTVQRPWGNFASLLEGERFQVKRLFVRPGRRLSLQKHHHRAEYWVVVRGTAEVTVDGAVVTVREGQSIHLPAGSVHRLGNPGRIDLEVVEVQIGSYLGEDDIVRLEDEFGRV